MKYKVIIDPLAKEDLREIFFYVSLNDSLEIANKLLDKIEETMKGSKSERAQKAFKVRKQKARRSRKSKEKMLDRYIKAITKKYPDDYLEVLKKDLSSEENFKRSVGDLDLEDMSDLDFLEDYSGILKKIKKS